MSFSSYFKFALPPYQTLRYDSELNNNFGILESALLGFPGSDPPGSAGNYSSVIPTNGMLWFDTSTNQLKVYFNSNWYVINFTHAITSTTSVSNTVTETIIWSCPIEANTLLSGTVIEIYNSGIVSNATAADDLTIKLNIGSTNLETFHPAIGNVLNADWHVESKITVRSIGASGSMAIHAHIHINDQEESVNSIVTIDTTTLQTLNVTVIWDSPNVSNIIDIYQGICKIDFS